MGRRKGKREKVEERKEKYEGEEEGGFIEFWITYGWAIIAVVVAIGALAYLLWPAIWTDSQVYKKECVTEVNWERFELQSQLFDEARQMAIDMFRDTHELNILVSDERKQEYIDMIHRAIAIDAFDETCVLLSTTTEPETLTEEWLLENARCVQAGTCTVGEECTSVCEKWHVDDYIIRREP